MKSQWKEVLEWGMYVIGAIIAALIIRYFVGTPTIVQQPSMYPTLKPEQRLILNKWSKTVNSEIERGDIVTFESPSSIKVLKEDINFLKPVAKYENEPNNIITKFIYHVLEINKTNLIKRVIGLPRRTCAN